MFRCIKVFGLICLSLWFLGAVHYYRIIHSYPKTGSAHTNAIVVLTGGSGRLSSGAKLLMKNETAHLFVTGVNAVTTKQDLKNFIALNNKQLNSSVTLGYEAQDTEGNAKETKQWILQNNITSIALVTAHYHMPRTLIEFRNILKGVDITPVAVKPDLFRSKGHVFKKIQVLFLEYNKFLLALFKSFIMS